MASIKLATFNIEWMIALFGLARDADWLANPEIPDSFAGGSRGSIRFDAIPDVPALCERIASTIRAVDPDILLVQEGPPLQEQMVMFVDRFLDGDYVVHRSNRDNQSIHALVRKPLAPKVSPWLPPGSTASGLWRQIPYYLWGTIGTGDRKNHALARQPLILKCELAPGTNLMLCGVHTKSKFSQLKTLAQWENRDTAPEPVLDALITRQKLSAEIARLRNVLTQVMATGPEFGHIVTLGDFNDGPFADVMEAEFLIGNLLDELVGSFLEPNTYFKHAMAPERLSSAATTRFRDPLKGGQVVEELIDHILVSPGIWSGEGLFRIGGTGCLVETTAWEANVDPVAPDDRQNRPSDHKPVSVVIDWDD